MGREDRFGSENFKDYSRTEQIALRAGRSSQGEEPFAVSSVEQRFASFLRDGFHDARIVVEDVEDDPAQGSEVLRRVAHAGLVVVFAEGRVQYPVAAVPDAPVASYGVLEVFRILFSAAGTTASFTLPFLHAGDASALRFHHAQACGW